MTEPGLLRPTPVLLGPMAAGAALIGYGALGQRRAERAAGADSGDAAAPDAVEDPAIEAPRELSPAEGGHPVLTGGAADWHRPAPTSPTTENGAHLLAPNRPKGPRP
ncbi:hypothetical protein [Streptomyces sp. NPDC058092]|uniref:hypothetical protein n=1 Tax=Streptomyces sp. NPDC058092 TaxID=3346336 RepID=UPI0036EFC010